MTLLRALGARRSVRAARKTAVAVNAFKAKNWSIRLKMKSCIELLVVWLLALSAQATVHVFVEDTNGVARLKYECTDGEVVQAFALDLSVDRGEIVGITNFFVGPSTAAAQGYGIFPASFRDHITVVSGTNANWNVAEYTPLASVADYPTNTLPGLNSSGVTLEFGALWDPATPAAVPGAGGTLCSLQLSQAANVSLSVNSSRGGVVSAASGASISPVLTGAFVGPAILSAAITNGFMIVTFKGGELETTTVVGGAWTGTGNTNGLFTEPVGANGAKFYRVRGH